LRDQIVIIGYHASHEQFAPSELLEFVRAAEEAGFDAVMTSDHIAPWSERQGNSGNNWPWLGAALASTSIPFGSLAIPGGWRYHPVVLAHLIATLAEMYPGRLRWIAVGSGEAMNESVVGKGWPEKPERDHRLRAGANIMRRLFRGETVEDDTGSIRTEHARLWSQPATPPAIFGAALTNKTARSMGAWVDGLITVRKSLNELRMLVEDFRAGGGDQKPLVLQLQVSWGLTKEEARLAAWDQWRCAAVSAENLASLRQPAQFDERTRNVAPDEMDRCILLIERGDELIEQIRSYIECGFEEIYIHNVSRNQLGFIDFMAREVLPAFLAHRDHDRPYRRNISQGSLFGLLQWPWR
jgi:coenzyme F420-dependent glucose-6-phosphate dehydrogenase